MLAILSLSFAGATVGGFGGAVFPLDSWTSSASGSEVGLYGGLRLGGDALIIQPEVVLRFNLAAPALALAPGVVLLGPEPVRVGGYVHLGIPDFIWQYPFPGGDGGLIIEMDAGLGATVGLRAGWEWVHPVHVKCDCPQASDQWLMVGATAGWAW